MNFFSGEDDSRVQIIIIIFFEGGGGGEMASSAKVTFIPVLLEPGQPGAAIFV